MARDKRLAFFGGLRVVDIPRQEGSLGNRHHDILRQFLQLHLVAVIVHLLDQALDHRPANIVIGDVERKGIEHARLVLREVQPVNRKPHVLESQLVDRLLGAGGVHALEDGAVLLHRVFVGIEERVVGAASIHPMEIHVADRLLGDVKDHHHARIAVRRAVGAGISHRDVALPGVKGQLEFGDAVTGMLLNHVAALGSAFLRVHRLVRGVVQRLIHAGLQVRLGEEAHAVFGELRPHFHIDHFIGVFGFHRLDLFGIEPGVLVGGGAQTVEMIGVEFVRGWIAFIKALLEPLGISGGGDHIHAGHALRAVRSHASKPASEDLDRFAGVVQAGLIVIDAVEFQPANKAPVLAGCAEDPDRAVEELDRGIRTKGDIRNEMLELVVALDPGHDHFEWDFSLLGGDGSVQGAEVGDGQAVDQVGGGDTDRLARIVINNPVPNVIVVIGNDHVVEIPNSYEFDFFDLRI